MIPTSAYDSKLQPFSLTQFFNQHFAPLWFQILFSALNKDVEVQISVILLPL